MIQFISLYVPLKQGYLNFINLHSFLFLYFKTSKQIHFPYLNTFHFITFYYKLSNKGDLTNTANCL